jgi:hypothetical protein
LVTGFKVKPANRKYAPPNHVHECVLSASATVTCINNVTSYPEVKFEICPFNQLCDLPMMALVDVAGIIVEVGNVEGYARDGSIGTKRVLKLVDKSEVDVTLTLWGSDADNFSAAVYSTFLGKGLRRGNYLNEATLSAIPTSLALLNSRLPEAADMEEWFAQIKIKHNLE